MDDYPFSGKKGMLIKPDTIYNAVTSIADYQNMRIIYTCPKGQVFTQDKANSYFESKESLIIIPGYYEGIDDRIFELLPIERVSIGDYILNSGESAAFVIAETILRQVPGVLGNNECIEDDSIFSNLLEAPQYTQPAMFMNIPVPDILRSGHHKNIKEWKKHHSLKQTLFMRPDLLARKKFDSDEVNKMTTILNEMVVKKND